jgi:hypothetical protein
MKEKVFQYTYYCPHCGTLQYNSSSPKEKKLIPCKCDKGYKLEDVKKAELKTPEELSPDIKRQIEYRKLLYGRKNSKKQI